MEIIEKIDLSGEEKLQIFKLWNTEYPVNIIFKSVTELELYLSKLKKAIHFLIIQESEIAGWFCEFERDGNRNFAMIISENLQGKGLGSKLLDQVKARNSELHGWAVIDGNYFKSNNRPYKLPLGFYEKNGFAILDDQVWETGKLKTVKIRWTQV